MDPATQKICKNLIAGYLGMDARARELSDRAAELTAEEKNVRRSQRNAAESIRGMGGGDMLDAAIRRLDEEA